ncbi:helix-turn-helix domain-containing protein [Paenibacillus ferrarius]|uniref:helix-turn-helix domain-containing protein n=1 Tax=Paenibacillus ferrarius TaxID=1469647 RepID=UPI003D2CD7FE
MEIFQEPIPYQNPSLCMKVWRFAQTGRAEYEADLWHYHKEIEFVLVEQGAHEIHTPNQVYRLGPGDIALVGASQLHRGRKPGEEELVYIVLHVDLQPYFDPAMMNYYRNFMEILRPLDDLNYIFQENAVAKREIAELIVRIHDEVMAKRKGYEIAVSMHVQHMLLLLLRFDERELLAVESPVDRDTEVLRELVQYVDEHLAEKIEMSEVSRLAGMSYTYFSRFFKKKMGASFTDYVNRKRIAKAERLLVTEHRSIGAIAEAVGIENMAHFYELFKRFNGCTPKQYLRKLNVEREG